MNFETICHRIKLKPNSIDRIYEWANEINSKKDEAYATLRDEGVIIESVFLEKAQEGYFLIYYMKMESVEKADEVVSNSKHAIDEYHKNFKKATWEKGEKLELLVDLERLGNEL